MWAFKDYSGLRGFHEINDRFWPNWSQCVYRNITESWVQAFQGARPLSSIKNRTRIPTRPAREERGWNTTTPARAAEFLQAFSSDDVGTPELGSRTRVSSEGTGEGARAEEIPSSATPVPADAKPPTVRTPEVHGEDPPRPSGGWRQCADVTCGLSGDGWSGAAVGRRGGGGARGRLRLCWVGGRRRSDYGSGLGSARCCEQRSLRRFLAPRRTEASRDSGSAAPGRLHRGCRGTCRRVLPREPVPPGAHDGADLR